VTRSNPTAARGRAPALALAALLWAGLGLAGCYHPHHAWHHRHHPHYAPHHQPDYDHHDHGARGDPYPGHHRWR